MKTIKARHKLIPAIIMLIVAAITMSTASYAWFTMSNRVEVTGVELTVVAPTNILIRNEGLDAPNPFLSSVTVTKPDGRLNNASSFDGVSLFTVSNPIDFVDEYGDTTSGVSLTDATSTPVAGTDGYYVDFDLQLINTGGTEVTVGLDELEISTVATSAANGTIIEAVRFAILESNVNTTHQVFSKSTNKIFDVYKTASSKDSLTTVETYNNMFELDANGVANANSPSPDGVKNITVRVWLEGEDPKCVSDNAGSTFAITFNFYVVTP